MRRLTSPERRQNGDARGSERQLHRRPSVAQVRPAAGTGAGKTEAKEGAGLCPATGGREHTPLALRSEKTSAIERCQDSKRKRG